MHGSPISLFVAPYILLFFCISAYPIESCPLYPLGVTSQQTDHGETFFASAFVRPFGEDEEVLVEARQEARLASRFLLQREKRVPLGANGRLVGAKDEGSCFAEGRVYFSVSINLKSAAQAIALSEQLQKSLGSKQTREIPSYSWTAEGDRKADVEGIKQLLQR